VTKARRAAKPIHVGGATLYLGDCLRLMASMPAASVDTIITDPPYGLTAGKKGGSGKASVNLDAPGGRARIGTGSGAGGFMGMKWDAGVPGVAFWQAALRVAKPGAMMLAFGGSRTWHRLACAIEDARWEIRDCVMWVYGSGFPKSLDISKAIDKAAGAKRKRIRGVRSGVVRGTYAQDKWSKEYKDSVLSSVPATAAARVWQGWGTALKPAWEPIIVAMKPLDGTFAQNALKHGVAGFNIDGCRVSSGVEQPSIARRVAAAKTGKAGGCLASAMRARAGLPPYKKDLAQYIAARPGESLGRWPANLIHDGSEEVVKGFPPTATHGHTPKARGPGGIGCHRHKGQGDLEEQWHDSGSAARFFYCAKAGRAEREAGLEAIPPRRCTAKQQNSKLYFDARAEGGNRATRPPEPMRANNHPTVKPLALMEYLCRLTSTPTGGVVLDPFMGSGSTGVACVQIGRRFIGIEIDPKCVCVAMRRIRHAAGRPLRRRSAFAPVEMAPESPIEAP